MSGGARPASVLIDGYNLLHAIPRFAPRGGPVAPARSRMEAWLARAARERSVSTCVVVWDGRAGGSKAKPATSLEVIYTPKDIEADDRLRDLMRGRFAGRAAETWVVSSDREVKRSARDLGFVALGAMTFWKRWSDASGDSKGRRRRPVSDAPEPSGKPRPTKAGVEELLSQMLDVDDEDEGRAEE